MRPRFSNLIILALLLAVQSQGRIVESFRVDEAAWNATHVVVATEGERDLTVLESWKGDLKPGDRIRGPELAGVTGKRMILFLVKKNAESWACAGPAGYKDSVAWSEAGRIFAFWQTFIPGSGELQDIETTEGELAAHVSRVQRLQESWQAALAAGDCKARVPRLVEFLKPSDERNLSWEVLAEMEKCGSDAGPAFHRILESDSMKHLHARAIDALVKTDGPAFGAELVERLDQEIRFWKATAPALPPGWWNLVSLPQTQDLRTRYGDTYAIVRALTALKVVEARERIIDLRNFWRSLPQLEDAGGLTQMSRECDSYLEQVH